MSQVICRYKSNFAISIRQTMLLVSPQIYSFSITELGKFIISEMILVIVRNSENFCILLR